MKKSIVVSSLFLIAIMFVAFKKGDKNAGLYKIDQSKSEMTWVGKKVIGSENGTINIKNGSVNYNGSTITSGSFTIDMNTIKTSSQEGENKGKLENHLKSADFFEVSKFPVSTFKIKKVVKGNGDNATATGALTIKGITRDITFPVKMSVMNGSMEITAKDIKVDRTKYGVKFASQSLKSTVSDKAINDDFIIGFTLILTK
ncbi:MAG: YceI family protein [Taibaiella sp.]|jgi:polyisoprenoid-binding protein YceI